MNIATPPQDKSLLKSIDLVMVNRALICEEDGLISPTTTGSGAA
jgi:hypothetical protein